MTVLHPVFGTPLQPGWEVLSVDEIKSPEKSSCVAGPFGSNISSKYFVADGVPVIRGSNLTDDLTGFVVDSFVFVSPEQALNYLAQHVRAGDLVFTCWGTVGQVGLIPDDGPYDEYIISNKQLKLRPDPSHADSRFLFYYFASPAMVQHIRNRAIGSAVPGINLGILKSLPVVLPPLTTQRKIVAILSAYDDLIENNNHRIKLLEEMTQRIYREWFVDFRYPGHEEVPLVDSELGPTPEGWTVHRLGDAVEFIYGKALKAAARKEGVVTVFGSGGAIGRHDEALAEGPGIIVGRKGNVGSVHWSDGAFFAIDTTYWVRTRIPLTYCYYALRDVEFFDSHAAVPGLSRDQAYSLPFVVPDSKTTVMFDTIALELFGLRRRIEGATENLRTTRDLLLPRLISGEVDVTDLDIALPEEAA